MCSLKSLSNGMVRTGDDDSCQEFRNSGRMPASPMALRLWHIRHSSRVCACLLLLTSLHAETWTLDQTLSSEMTDGTRFSATGPDGVKHTGWVRTHKAQHFSFGRGSLRLEFDEPYTVINGDREGTFRPSRVRQVVRAGATLAAAKLADDVVDTSLGPGKARYVGLAAGVTAFFLQSSGNVKLKAGSAIEVEPGRKVQ
jgi:hypothetical protein